MTLIERTIAITSKDADGNTTLDMPITKVENVEGALTETEIDTKISTAISNSNPEVNTSNLVDLTSGQAITGEKIFSGGLTTSTGLTVAGSSESDLLSKEITWKAGTTSYGSLNHLRYTGNATTATKLQTARTITVDGDMSGNVSFDGTADQTLSLTLEKSGVTASSYGQSANATLSNGGTFKVPYITVDAKGRITKAYNRTLTLPTIDSSGNSSDTSESSYGWVDLTTTSSYTTKSMADFPFTIHCFDLSALGNVQKVYIYFCSQDANGYVGSVIACSTSYLADDVNNIVGALFNEATAYRYTAYTHDASYPMGATIEITSFPFPYLYVVDLT